MSRSKIVLLAAFLLAAPALGLPADDAKPGPAAPLVVIDSAGKEHKVKDWKVTAGTMRLSWLAPAEKADEKPQGDKAKAAAKRPAPAGPEALVVRDELKIHFLAGVTTLVPLDRLRSVRFDSEKDTMTVQVAVSDKPEEDVTLVGTTAYKGINKLSLLAEVDKGDAGIAELTYQGGVPRGNLKEVRFPAPKAGAEKPGRPAVVETADKGVKKTHKVADLQPLYRLASGREKLSPLLMFRKTLRIDVSKVKSITAGTEDGDDLVWRVAQKDGEEASLTLLESATLDGGSAKLVGLVGRVPAGYKLFPLRRIAAVHFDSSEEKKE
jgi:hypothetical protein